MSIFERVKKIASDKGFSSLKSLSEEAGLSQNVIYGWKRTAPSATSLRKVADVLGVSVDYLLGNTNDMHSNNELKTVDLTTVAKTDSWDDYVSADGRPLSEHDKRVLRAMFGDE